MNCEFLASALALHYLYREKKLAVSIGCGSAEPNKFASALALHYLCLSER